MLDMDGLLNVVANDTEKVVAVVTEPFWANAQCIGQIVLDSYSSESSSRRDKVPSGTNDCRQLFSFRAELANL
eukprot:1752096-Amphidinium_carterae.1